MSGPRVTVPVELADRIKAFLAQAREDRKNSGKTRQALEINAMLHGLITAPEGGAVLEDALDAWIVEGMKKADQRIAEITPVGCSGMTTEDVKTGRVSAYQKGFQNGVKSTLADAAFVIMNAALATPAGAGEIAQILTGYRNLGPHSDRDAAIAHLCDLLERAQPPAREDALRVAVEALGPFAHIASHVGLPRDGTVHLTALDGKWIATIDRADFWRAASVLAALQAEQEAK